MSLPQTSKDVIPPPPTKLKGPSSFVKAGVGLLTTALVDTIVAFSTSYWATWNKPDTGEKGGYGLWKMWSCTRHVISDGEVTKEGEICNERLADFTNPFPGWYVTTQVFMTLALAGILSSVIMLFLYMFLPQWDKNKAALSTLIAISYLSGLFIMVALFVFGFKVAEEIEERNIKEWFLSWSFSLACTALLLNQIAASVLITENKRLFQSLNDKPNENDHLLKTDTCTDDEDTCPEEKLSSVMIT